MENQEVEKSPMSGWVALPFAVAGVPIQVYFFWKSIVLLESGDLMAGGIWLTLSTLLPVVWGICLRGFFTLQPNMACVILLFGDYVGTVGKSGFYWANPFYTRIKVSLRARNLNGEIIKVNDSRGNPIEIAAVIVWRVKNTYQATFDVDDFEHYVSVQSEAAIRHLASAYPYDPFEGDELSLRGNLDEVSAALTKALQDRADRAGVEIDEARISHLAYATEIASVMLQRQQADAIVAARTRIVEGAVGMVEMALAKLEEHGTIQLDEERKAAMVSNLLVVLCGEKGAQPVMNTGTLHN